MPKRKAIIPRFFFSYTNRFRANTHIYTYSPDHSMRKKRPTPSAPLVAAASVASVAADRAPFARVLSYTYSAAPDVSPSDVRTTARAGKAASGTGGVRGGWEVNGDLGGDP